MKKNYSTPEFMLVALGSNDIVCSSDKSFAIDPNAPQATGAGAKRRTDIWDE